MDAKLSLLIPLLVGGGLFFLAKNKKKGEIEIELDPIVITGDKATNQRTGITFMIGQHVILKGFTGGPNSGIITEIGLNRPNEFTIRQDVTDKLIFASFSDLESFDNA